MDRDKGKIIKLEEQIELLQRKLNAVVARFPEAAKIIDSIQEDEDRDEMTNLLTAEFIRGKASEIMENTTPDTASDKKQAMLLIDADRFKEINDGLGRLTGDVVIRYLADQIRKNFDASELVARIVEDEFMVFLPETTVDEARKKADAVNQSVGETFQYDSMNITVTCSVGIAFRTDGKMSYDELFYQAEHALIDAKENGRNCFAIYEEQK